MSTAETPECLGLSGETVKVGLFQARNCFELRYTSVPAPSAARLFASWANAATGWFTR